MEVRVRDTPVSKSRPDSAHKELTFLRVIIKCPVLIERKSTEGKGSVQRSYDHYGGVMIKGFL